MTSIPITASLLPPGPFWTFNREARNAVAILFGLLARPGNLAAFSEVIGWTPTRLDEAEIAVEWTYLRDLWRHHSDSDRSRNELRVTGDAPSMRTLPYHASEIPKPKRHARMPTHDGTSV